MHKVRIAPLAERQLDHALAWYSDQAPDQVFRLLSAFDEARRRIGSQPLLFREVEPDLRRIALRVFPYHLWFSIDDDVVIIVAVTHFRQETSYLTQHA